MVGGVDGDGLGELVTVCQVLAGGLIEGDGICQARSTNMASSKFFAAMALLPRALSSSAVDILVLVSVDSVMN